MKTLNEAMSMLFDEPVYTEIRTPWEQYHMTREEWVKWYNRQMDEAVEFRRFVNSKEVYVNDIIMED